MHNQLRSPKPPSSVGVRHGPPSSGEVHSFAKPCFFEVPNSPVPNGFWLRFGTPKPSENRPETGSATRAETGFVLEPVFDVFSELRNAKILQKHMENR